MNMSVFNKGSIPNPNGIPSLSPGLRGTSYPGCPMKTGTTLKGLRHAAPDKPGMDATPLGLEKIFDRFPRIAPASQPWADGRNPFGIETGAGSTGYQPVPSGHWPDGTAGRPLWPWTPQEFRAALPVPRGESPRVTGGSPVLPIAVPNPNGIERAAAHLDRSTPLTP